MSSIYSKRQASIDLLLTISASMLTHNKMNVQLVFFNFVCFMVFALLIVNTLKGTQLACILVIV